MAKYYSKLLFRFIVISWQKIKTFNFEFLMTLVHLVFNFSFILIFWYTLLSHIKSFGDWSFPELALFTGITFLGESIGGIFFGFRDLPSTIVNGDLDKFLVRPVNTLFAVLFDQVSIVYFIEELIVSIFLIIVIVIQYNVSINPLNVIFSLVILSLGVLVYNCLYGMVTFLAFWVGQVGVFRSLIFGLADSKQYPMTIFPKKVQFILTYIIPVAFISYYPAVIFMNKVNLDSFFLLKFLAFSVIIFYLFSLVWNRGLKRYEANGG